MTYIRKSYLGMVNPIKPRIVASTKAAATKRAKRTILQPGLPLIDNPNEFDAKERRTVKEVKTRGKGKKIERLKRLRKLRKLLAATTPERICQFYLELDQREKKILDERVLGPKTKILFDIGADLNLTGQRIRQIEVYILRKLIVFLGIEEDIRLTGNKEVYASKHYIRLKEALKIAEKEGRIKEITATLGHAEIALVNSYLNHKSLQQISKETGISYQNLLKARKKLIEKLAMEIQ